MYILHICISLEVDVAEIPVGEAEVVRAWAGRTLRYGNQFELVTGCDVTRPEDRADMEMQWDRVAHHSRHGPI